MNQLTKVFDYQDGQLRTALRNGEPWFVAKDVCDLLEVGNSSQALNRLEDDEKGLILNDTPGGRQEMAIINEPGLYSLILGSRKPEAKAFKRWITREVIPSIRKHGAYMTGDALEKALTSPDFLIQLARKLKEEQQARIAAEQKIQKDIPKVLFADAVTASKTSILVGELAKILKQNSVEIGQNRLFIWMRKNGFLISRNGTDYNMPTQKSMELGLFEIKETSVTHSDGHITVSKTPKVTGKGQVYFINKFKRGVSA